MEYYAAVKKKLLHFATVCIDLENICKQNKQSEKDTAWSHLHVESNEQTELTSKIETDSLIECKVTAIMGGWGG